MEEKKVEDLNVAVKTIDFLSIHMPLNKETKNLIDINILKKMKKNTIIVNTARGGVINEIALDKALKDKILLIKFEWIW